MLKRLKIWQKLLLIVLVMATAIPVIFYLISTRDEATIDFGQAERYGDEYLVPTKSLFMHALLVRDLGDAILAGNAGRQDEISKLHQPVDADLVAIAAVHQRVGKLLARESDEVGKQLDALRKEWAELRGVTFQPSAPATASSQPASGEAPAPAAGTNGAPATETRHREFVQHIIEFIAQVGDSSNLILDPDIDTYYLMAAVIYQLPPLADDLGAVRSLGTAVAAKSAISANERLQLAALLGRAQMNLDAVRKSMEDSAFPYNPSLVPELRPALTAAVQAVNSFQGMTRDRMLMAPSLAVDSHVFFDSASESIDQVSKLYDAQLRKLDALIGVRIDKFKSDKVYILGATIIGVILAILLVALIARAILRQINHINDALSAINVGDYKARAKVTAKDELGHMAQSLNSVLDNVVTLIQSREERDRIQESIKLLDEVSGVASGDLTIEAEVTADMTGAIADSFNLMISELRQIIGNVKDTTLQLSSAASEIQATSDHLSRGSESQSEQIVETSAAIEEMAVSIQQVSENANVSASVAQQSLSNARQGSQAVQKTMDGMNSIREQVSETAKRIKRLGESSQEIGEIIQLIGDIADRTSILALNASIQAAMAGEAGRGFAVVAEEVERLAVRSTEATKRVATLVKTIQTETAEAVSAMEGTTSEVVRGTKLANEGGKALVEIETVSNRLAELMQSISLAAKQQARGSEALAKSMSEISDITQQTAAGTKQSAVSISNLSSLADELRESVSRFKLPAA